ncbi:MAG: translation initiation factor IF-3 [Alphaproteobacteria bacterium]|nr:translation initiation factor IF-3 [Alphaproteobacteria bacterium]
MANTQINVNNKIRAREVRVIDATGANLGVMSTAEALGRARADGLDLIEISPTAMPPICKIMDYGKYKYEESKRAAQQRKNQKTVELKELTFRPNIEKHDLDVKLKAARKFIAEGNKVKFTIRFRGRELSNMTVGINLFDRIKAELADEIKVEKEPTAEGRQMQMVVAPAK